MDNTCEIILAGAGIIDIPVVPFDAAASAYSVPHDRITMNPGGDALNEALVLGALGKKVRLISRMGDDDAADYLLSRCEKAGVDTTCVTRAPEIDTGINVVLVDEAGERRFLTNRNGSLRKLELSDFTPEAMQGGRIFCFASIFVFPLLGVPEMAEIFRRAGRNGMIVCADTTMPKNHETLEELAPALQYVDYLFPNLAEARAVTGLTDPHEITQAFCDAGVKTVVLKCGRDGCLLRNAEGEITVPGYPARCIDTTGAGDNFVAGFLCAKLDGKSDIECARYANAVASVCVESVGASTGVRSRALPDERYAKLLERK